MTRLVDPPVAISPTIPFTKAFSSRMRDRRVLVAERGDRHRTRAAASVSASRKGVPGFTKLAPGRCSPMNSISIWLVLAVP
jgi:hypothetical protein